MGAGRWRKAPSWWGFPSSWGRGVESALPRGAAELGVLALELSSSGVSHGVLLFALKMGWKKNLKG